MMELTEEIKRLKRERNAIILAHNYQSPEIRAVADFVGDTFALAVEAADLKCDSLIFCGPDFMVEMAALLNPDKRVIYANPAARCPMAAMCTGEDIDALREMYPDAPVVGYMNISIECKAKVDICCGSRNCVEIVRGFDAKRIILVPDINLATYVQRCVPEKTIIPWLGFCVVHQRIRKEDIEELMRAHPNAEVLAHPECASEVMELSTHILSTDGFVEYVAKSPSNEFIIATEIGIVHRLIEAAPSKRFYTLSRAVCGTQKRVILRDVVRALETLEPQVSLKEETVLLARRSIERMLSFQMPKSKIESA